MQFRSPRCGSNAETAIRDIQGQRPVFVVKGKDDLAIGQAAPLFRAAENDILHFAAPQALDALFAQHPAHRIGDVALAAAVGAHDPRDAVFEGDLGVVGKGFEAVYFPFS